MFLVLNWRRSCSTEAEPEGLLKWCRLDDYEEALEEVSMARRGDGIYQRGKAGP